MAGSACCLHRQGCLSWAPRQKLKLAVQPVNFCNIRKRQNFRNFQTNADLGQGGNYGESRETGDVPDDTSGVSRAGDDVPAAAVDGHARHDVRVVDGGDQVAASGQAEDADTIVPVAAAEEMAGVVRHGKHLTAQLHAWVEWAWHLASRPGTVAHIIMSKLDILDFIKIISYSFIKFHIQLNFS